MDKKLTPTILLAAIRANCLECCGGSRREVRNCVINYCQLWPYRMGIQREKNQENINEIAGQMSLFDGNTKKKTAS